jgi:exosortase A-associated hydrolase 2
MHPAFIDGSAGRLFTLYFAPDPGTPTRGALLFVPPFAEELNRSRHMIVKTARALSARGWGVLLLDLYGTGDSEGDYTDARWPLWIDDVKRGVAHLHTLGHAAVGLWAMRTGCLLAAEALAGTACAPLIFWQPVLKGKTFLNQFIRIGLAASLTGGDASGQDLRQRLAAGQPVEIAGYTLHPELAAGLEAATLAGDMAWPAPLSCIEVGAGDALSPPLAKAVDGWREHGARVEAHAITGPQFWMQQEPEWVDGLIAATVAAVDARQAVS